MQFSAPMVPIWPKRTHRNVFMVMKCFCLQYYSNIRHPLTVYCTSISTLPTFQCSICALPHQSMVDYTGHFMTYVILSFCRFFSSYECKKKYDRQVVILKLSSLSKHVKLYYKLWISFSEVPFSIEPTAWPLYFILIQPKRWRLCDKIKLSDSCRWKYEYTHGEKHLAFVCHVQNRYKYFIVTHRWTSQLNQSLLCSIDGYMCPNILCQISFQTV